MKYGVTLEFDEDWTVTEVEDLLHETNLDFFCRVIDVKEMENKNEKE